MTAEHRSEEQSSVPGTGGLHSAARRRLFRGAAGGAGVLLTVHAKTALGATICQSPSAAMSGNTSPRPSEGASCSGGRSPGFWKVPQKFEYWATIAITPTFKQDVEVSACDGGIQGLTLDDIAKNGQGTVLGSVFAGATNDFGFWAALAFPNDVPGGQLLRHLVAAYLNAGYFTAVSGGAGSYPITQSQVKEMWIATSSPGGLYGAGKWTAQDVINYISGMYDINAEVEAPLCNKKKKKN